jgi:hypothetical protein
MIDTICHYQREEDVGEGDMSFASHAFNGLETWIPALVTGYLALTGAVNQSKPGLPQDPHTGSATQEGRFRTAGFRVPAG